MEDLNLHVESIFNNYLLEEPLKVIYEQNMGFSGACVQVLECKWKPHVNENVVTSSNIKEIPPKRLFVKYIVFPPLPDSTSDAARLKTIRNIQTYVNEINFNESYAPELRKLENVIIPRCFKSIHTKNEKVESFLFINESVDHGEQLPSFGVPEMSVTLHALARFHALFHNTVSHSNDVYGQALSAIDPNSVNAHGIWNHGGHLALSKRPSGEVDKLAPVWDTLCTSFHWSEYAGLGARLFKVADFIADHVNSFSRENKEFLTLIHGDIKTANLFFMSAASDTTEADVCFIDFQWAGVGLAATDLFYLLATSCSDDYITLLDTTNDVQELFLRPYFDCFIQSHQSRLCANGGASSDANTYVFEKFTRHFQYAALDYMRWLVSYRLDGETPDKYAARKQKLDINIPTYKRSEVVLKFLFKLVAVYLPVIETAYANQIEAVK